MGRLTKEDLLRSVADPQEVHIEALDGVVLLAPLTDGQWSQIEKIQMAGIKASGEAGDAEADMTFDVADVVANQHEAYSLAAWYSLNSANPEDKWTREEISRMTPMAVEQIGKAVLEISGVGGDIADRVSQFRKD